MEQASRSGRIRRDFRGTAVDSNDISVLNLLRRSLQVSPVQENVQAIMYTQMPDPARSHVISVMTKDSCPVTFKVFYQDAYLQDLSTPG